MRLQATRWRALMAVCLGTFLVAWGITPISALMPTLTGEFGVDITLGSWAMAAYFLVLVGLTLPAGRLGDRLGHLRLFTWGIAVFALSFAVAGLVHSFWLFLGLRVVQGAATALINGTALAIVNAAFPAHQRGRAIAAVAVASTAGAGIAVGTATLLLQLVSWRWSFFVPLPLAAAALVLALGLPRAAPPATERRCRTDVAGPVWLFLALVFLVLGLGHFHDGGETFSAGWRWHLSLHALALIAGIAFVRAEARAEDPIVPLALLRSRVELTRGATINLIVHGTMMGAIFLVPYHLERGLLLTPTHTAGVAVLGSAITVTLAPFSGYVCDRWGTRILLRAALAVLALGVFTISLPGQGGTYAAFFSSYALLATAVGLANTASNTSVMAAAPPGAAGLASGILELSRQLGHTLGTSTMATALAAGLAAGPASAALFAALRQAWAVLAVAAVVGSLLLTVPMRARACLPRAAGGEQ